MSERNHHPIARKNVSVTTFVPAREKLEKELEMASFVDSLLAPLENNQHKVSVAILHEVHASLKRRCRYFDLETPCEHTERFIQLVLRHVHYIANRGFLKKIETSIIELETLKKLLPREEHRKIDHEISTLEKTKHLLHGERGAIEHAYRRPPNHSHEQSWWEKFLKLVFRI